MARWKKTAFLLIRLKIRGWFRQGMIGKSCVIWSRSASASNEREDGRCLTRDQSGWWKGNENPWDIENREYFYAALQVGNKTEIFSKFFFLSLECTPRSRFKRMIYRVERCRFDEQEKKSCKKLQCSPPVSTRIVKDDGHKRFLIRDRTYKYGRTSEEQIFQGVIMLL